MRFKIYRSCDDRGLPQPDDELLARIDADGYEPVSIAIEPGSTYGGEEYASRYTGEKKYVVRTGSSTLVVLARQK